MSTDTEWGPPVHPDPTTSELQPPPSCVFTVPTAGLPVGVAPANDGITLIPGASNISFEDFGDTDWRLISSTQVDFSVHDQFRTITEMNTISIPIQQTTTTEIFGSSVTGRNLSNSEVRVVFQFVDVDSGGVPVITPASITPPNDAGIPDEQKLGGSDVAATKAKIQSLTGGEGEEWTNPATGESELFSRDFNWEVPIDHTFPNPHLPGNGIIIHIYVKMFTPGGLLPPNIGGSDTKDEKADIPEEILRPITLNSTTIPSTDIPGVGPFGLGGIAVDRGLIVKLSPDTATEEAGDNRHAGRGVWGLEPVDGFGDPGTEEPANRIYWTPRPQSGEIGQIGDLPLIPLPNTDFPINDGFDNFDPIIPPRIPAPSNLPHYGDTETVPNDTTDIFSKTFFPRELLLSSDIAFPDPDNKFLRPVIQFITIVFTGTFEEQSQPDPEFMLVDLGRIVGDPVDVDDLFPEESLQHGTSTTVESGSDWGLPKVF